MAHKHRFDGVWHKNAAGIYVQSEPISTALVAAAATNDIPRVKSDDTLEFATLTAGTDITITHGAGTITIASTTSGGGGGGLVLLDTQTASNSATLDMVTGIDDTYDEYELHFALRADTDGANLRMRLSSDGGSTWDQSAGNYRFHLVRFHDGTGGIAQTVNTGSQTYIGLLADVGSATGEGMCGVVRFATLRDTTIYKLCRAHIYMVNDSGQADRQDVVGLRASTSAFNGIQLFLDSGNFATGWSRLYGIAKS